MGCICSKANNEPSNINTNRDIDPLINNLDSLNNQENIDVRNILILF